MKDYRIENIRNICLAGHGGSGKTSLAEAILFTTGEIDRLGDVGAGNTTSDYRKEEIDHKISMNLTPLHCEWIDHTIHFIDTPGYSDFTSEVQCAARVSDSIAIILRAIEGIEIETEHAWEYAEEYGLPRMLVVNLLDKEHADFFDVLNRLQERFGQQAVPFQIPIGTSESFSGVVDLVSMKAITYDRGGDGKGKIQDIPNDLADQAEEYRETGDVADQVFKVLNLMGQSHPFYVLRLAEIRSWIEEGEYDRILRGEYAHRGDPDPSYNADLSDATKAYADGAKDLFGQVTGAAKRMADDLMGSVKR